VSSAQVAALSFGALWLALGFCAAWRPQAFLAAWQRFPRHRLLGWALAALAVTWATYKLYFFPMEGFQKIRTYVVLLSPLYLYGLVVCLPDLLAARMLACTLLLCCEPWLDAIRWEATPLRLLMTVMVYVVIVATMFMAVSPFKFRHWTARLFPDPARTRPRGAALAVYGLAVIGIGIFAFA
jgi:hypothetical protein